MLRNLKREIKAGRMTPHDYDKKFSHAVHRRDKDAVKLLLPHAYVNTAVYEDVHKYPDLRVLEQDDDQTDVCSRHFLQRRVVEEALINRDLDIVEMLLQKGLDPAVWVYFGVGADIYGSNFEGGLLLRAAMQEDVEVAKLLVKYGADVNDNSSYNKSPMFEALGNNNLQLTKLFLKHGGDPNHPTTTFERLFPVTFCIRYTNIKLLNVLLAHGVDINVVNVDYELDNRATLLDEAIGVYIRQTTTSSKKKALRIIHRLLEYNVDPLIQYQYIGDHPPRQALEIPLEVETIMQEYRHKQTVEYLSTLTLDQLNTVDSFGKSALHRSAENGDEEAVDFLLLKGVDAWEYDHLDRTPQMIALQRLEWFNMKRHHYEEVTYPIFDDGRQDYNLMAKPYKKIARKIGVYLDLQQRIEEMVNARDEDRDNYHHFFTKQVLAMNSDTFRELIELIRGSVVCDGDDDDDDDYYEDDDGDDDEDDDDESGEGDI